MHKGTLHANIEHEAHSSFFLTYSPAQLTPSHRPLIGLFIANISALILSCVSDMSTRRDHSSNFCIPPPSRLSLIPLFLHCLADHLLLQLTCEWSWWPGWLTPGEHEAGKSCERPGLSGWDWSLRWLAVLTHSRNAGLSFLSGSAPPSDTLAWCDQLWQVLPSWGPAGPRTRQELCPKNQQQAQGHAGNLILGLALTTAPITPADLIVSHFRVKSWKQKWESNHKPQCF